MHKDAPSAHRAAAAAHNQGKFWEFHDKLFANQSSLNTPSYLKYARELKLDVDRFAKDIASPAGIDRVIEADKSEADSLGVTGTPGFFVNGRFLSGAKSYEEFAKVIDAELARLNIPVPKANKGA